MVFCKTPTQSTPRTFSIKKTLYRLGFLVVCVTAFILYDQFQQTRYFPVKNVKIVGAMHIDHTDVQNMVLPLVRSGFFAVDVHTIKERLLQIPWVANVVVSRQWPDQVKITLVEKAPVARWNDKSLLSRNGELFMPAITTYPSDLPSFIGPEGAQLEMLEYYEKINHSLSLVHFKIAQLELTPFHGWNITLDNGMKMSMGHKDILTRIDHFVKVYPKIVGARTSLVEYIDLRYSNGFAVRWKSVL